MGKYSVEAHALSFLQAGGALSSPSCASDMACRSSHRDAELADGGPCDEACGQADDAHEAICCAANKSSAASCASEQVMEGCRQEKDCDNDRLRDSSGSCDGGGAACSVAGRTCQYDEKGLFDMSPEWRRALCSLASVPGLNVFARKAWPACRLLTSESADR